MPDDIGESYERLFKALGQLLTEAQRVGDNGVREWASLAMLDAIDFAEALGMMWDVEAERRREEVRAEFGDLDRARKGFTACPRGPRNLAGGSASAPRNTRPFAPPAPPHLAGVVIKPPRSCRK